MIGVLAMDLTNQIDELTALSEKLNRRHDFLQKAIQNATIPQKIWEELVRMRDRVVEDLDTIEAHLVELVKAKVERDEEVRRDQLDAKAGCD